MRLSSVRTAYKQGKSSSRLVADTQHQPLADSRRRPQTAPCIAADPPGIAQYQRYRSFVAKYATFLPLFAFAALARANQMRAIEGHQTALQTITGKNKMRNLLTTIFASIAAVSISGVLFTGILA